MFSEGLEGDWSVSSDHGFRGVRAQSLQVFGVVERFGSGLLGFWRLGYKGRFWCRD